MPDPVEGTVDRIRFVSEGNHWTVAAVKTDAEMWPITVVGQLPGLAEGMRVRLEGRWVDDPKWGRQLKAERYVELVPATTRGLQAYLASGFIDGIGEKMAERIVGHFGEDTLEVIRSEPERLAQVPGLGAKRVESIVQSFRERRSAQEALIFLHELGITPGLANKIYQRYEDDTVAVVRSNPYRLAEEVHGIGFHKADQVARGLDIDRDHPARVRAGAWHVLNQARSEGHCYLRREPLVGAAAQLTEVEPDAVQPAVTDLAMAGRVILDEVPDDPTDQAVYPTPLHQAEERTARHVSLLLREPHAEDSQLQARVAEAAASVGVDLAPEQEQACALALSGGVVIVTGGPGTGKTTIIRTVLAASGLDAHRIALAAPTGRAAKRMSESTDFEARTIHRLLEFSPVDGGFQRDEEDPLDVDLVVIDEASMMDLPLFDALVRAVPPSARLVLVGDVDQLPPVGPGSPLTDLIRSERVPVARLTQIFRQGRGSAIIENAHRINQGRAPDVTPPGTPLQDFYFIHQEHPAKILETIEKLVTDRIPERFGHDPTRDVQVLSPMRNGLLGVDNLNHRLQALLNPEGGEELRAGATIFRVGDRVMQIRNDYERGVFNGDLGFVAKLDPSARRVTVSIDGEPVVYESSQLDELVLAYAISVHKSQGSEYPAVVLPVTTQHFKMLQRNLIYTGVTRGRELVVGVGTPRAMEIAVRNSELAARNSQLAHRLQGVTGTLGVA